MLEGLTNRFQGILKVLRGHGRLTEANMQEGLREIRLALLEADVHVKVAKEFIDRVKTKALGAEVLQSLSPDQQLVKILMDELKALLGEGAAPLRISGSPPNVVLMVGLQGSGKTSATAFSRALALTGVVLTKLDGDARGGAALSIKSVTGVPIKFAGVGEKVEDLEIFHPERMASRIVGMGDVLSLIEKVEAVVDKDEAEEAARTLPSGEFTLEDLRQQMHRMKKMGPLFSLLQMLPGDPSLC